MEVTQNPLVFTRNGLALAIKQRLKEPAKVNGGRGGGGEKCLMGLLSVETNSRQTGGKEREGREEMESPPLRHLTLRLSVEVWLRGLD